MFVIHSECQKGMAKHIADQSIDAIVTDPPYGLSKQPDMAEVLTHWLAGDEYDHKSTGFMGKSWDSFVPGPSIWKEAIRCLKPGGHALVFAGSRTQDLMSMSLRLAGFEIRDCAMWLYGSGFPKSLNVEKATGSPEWEGYGTALKPAYEPIIIARKPLDGTVANNVLTYGTGGLNIDGCRVGSEVMNNSSAANVPGGNSYNMSAKGMPKGVPNTVSVGRWPANVIHDGLSEEWARYFYCAKTSKADRNAGLEDFAHVSAGESVNRKEGTVGIQSPSAGAGRTSGSLNPHPTVKPTELMRYLCRLVGHPGAVIMDPFSGSGSTGRGAVAEGFGFIGFEMDQKFCEIANARILDALSIT